jgi:predicted metalloenzyme YecM
MNEMIDFRQTSKFLDRVFLELLRSGIDASRYELDHICYRVESDEEYEEIQHHLADMGDILCETEIA